MRKDLGQKAWTNEITEDYIKKGKLTAFDELSAEKTKWKNMICRVCYNFAHRLNRLECCGTTLCTACLQAMTDPEWSSSCRFCHKRVGQVVANYAKPRKVYEQEDREEMQKQKSGEYREYLMNIVKRYKIVECLQEQCGDLGIDDKFINEILDTELIDDLKKSDDN